MRPRLLIHRSHKHIEAIVLDPLHAGRVVVQMKSQGNSSPKTQAAAALGEALASALNAQGITALTFDRRHYRYHGRIQALIERLRQAGIRV